MEGNGHLVNDDSLVMKGKIEFNKPKSYSIIALNIETVEDVEKVIRQCKLIKNEMSDLTD